MGRAVRKTGPTGILYGKLTEQWDSIAEFLRDTRCPASGETVRKVVYDGQPVSAVSLIVIAQSIGCSPAEIRRMLTDEAEQYVQAKRSERDYARRLADLIGSGAGERITGADKTILDALHALVDRTDVYHGVAHFIALYAGTLGMDALKRKLKRL